MAHLVSVRRRERSTSRLPAAWRITRARGGGPLGRTCVWGGLVKRAPFFQARLGRAAVRCRLGRALTLKLRLPVRSPLSHNTANGVPRDRPPGVTKNEPSQQREVLMYLLACRPGRVPPPEALRILWSWSFISSDATRPTCSSPPPQASPSTGTGTGTSCRFASPRPNPTTRATGRPRRSPSSPSSSCR